MKNILIPTDFSENANQAIKFAIQLAIKSGCKLHFLHTLQTKANVDIDKSSFETLKEENKKFHLEKLKESIEKSYQSQNLHFEADAHKFIVKESVFVIESVTEVAETYQIDLIVMGTQGATGLKKVLVGSNTSNVMEKAGCPVLAIPADYEFQRVKHIAYASELYEIEKELEKVIEYVKLFDATLDIFHVMPVYPQKVDVKTMDNDAFLEKIRKHFGYEKFNLHFVNTQEDNDLGAGIQFFVECYKPNMLIMFTQKRNWFDKIFNASKTGELATNTKIPLLEIKK